MTSPQTRLQHLRARTEVLMPQVIDDLAALVAMPSVAFPDFPARPVIEAGEATAALLRRCGLDGARLIEIPDGFPLVYGEAPAAPGAPTVLLYAHYDVQPVPEPSEWTSDPWALVERDGRLYARGAADDKSGVVMHAAALSLLGASRRVGIKAVIEGEEETESHLPAFIDANPELFAADVILVADMGNPAVGQPALVTALRGEIPVVITVKTLSRRSHSGAFGGPVPDAMMALVRILDSLVDEKGDVAVEGMQFNASSGDPDTDSDRQIEGLRRAAGMLAGTEVIGSGSLPTRLWSRPSATIIGLDAPSVTEAGNSLLPTARAKVSFRTVRPADSGVETQAIAAHLRAHTPFGAQVHVDILDCTPAFSVQEGAAHLVAKRALEEAFGVPCVVRGSGASIPLLGHLRAAAPDAEFILYGAEDGERSRIHDADESVDVHDLERTILAEALMLSRLGEER